MVMRTSRSDPEKDEYSEDSESEDVRPIEKNTKVSSRRVRAGVEASGIVVHDNQGPTDVDALSEVPNSFGDRIGVGVTPLFWEGKVRYVQQQF